MKLLLLLSIVAVFILGCAQLETDTTNTSQTEVPQACTLEYAPVCGVDGVTYGNACAAEVEGVEIDYIGECESDEPITMCPAIYAPVSGVDDVTYGNDCVAESEGVEIAYQGECIEDSELLQACTREYMPVCGVDGQTYPNACVAESQNVEIAYEGECQRVNSSYVNGTYMYAVTVEKPTPCHEVVVEEFILESFPAQLQIDLEVTQPYDDIMCAQVLARETINNSVQVDNLGLVTFILDGNVIFTEDFS
ncbi:MAG: Kazal-type serine protease inhibitor domain-containing protein [Candidatus Woesearchaeota archaeon]